MRKVVAGLFISVDGVVEEPSKWSFPYFNDELMAGIESMMKGQDTVLLGRKGYQEWASYWPTSTDEPFATFINNVPKYVVSKTLDKVEWSNSTLIRGDLATEVKRLKEQPGGVIGVQASPTLTRSLLELGLLDELMLAVHPIVVGSGQRLFPEGYAQVPLKLVSNKTTSTGIAMMMYEPDRTPKA